MCKMAEANHSAFDAKRISLSHLKRLQKGCWVFAWLLCLRLALLRLGFSLAISLKLHLCLHGRNFSEGPLKFMISEGATMFSFGHHFSVFHPFKMYDVSQQYSPWETDDDLQLAVEAKRDDGKECFFDVSGTIANPVVLLLDNGKQIHVTNDVDMNDLTCTYFTNRPIDPSMGTMSTTGQSSEPVVMINTSTNLEILQTYVLAVYNHQEYCRYHGYEFVLALVSPEKVLKGRNPKFAKPLATGVSAHKKKHELVCHFDLDAWFVSWDALSVYSSRWPEDKDLVFADTQQYWLNTGFMCVRPTDWALQILENVINSHHHLLGEAKVGFQRDQPAVWHELFKMWSGMGIVRDYLGHDCPMWKECGIHRSREECWQVCYWDVLRRRNDWNGLHSVNELPHVHLETLDPSLPQMHRMCLCTQCFKSKCIPESRGRYCMEKMVSEGGAYLLHTGSDFWNLIKTEWIPISKHEARRIPEKFGRDMRSTVWLPSRV